MRTTGIIRRIDELGRVVIPKEIRRTMRLREGEQMEIFVSDTGLILKKFSGMENIADLAREYAEALYEVTNNGVMIADNDKIVGTGGAAGGCLGKTVVKAVERLFAARTIRVLTGGDVLSITGESVTARSQIIAPIVSAGDIAGGIIALSNEKTLSEPSVKHIEIAAKFFGNILQ